MPKGKVTGTIAALSLEVRTQINVKLRDGESLDAVALWLFDEMKLGGSWLSGDVPGTNARDKALEKCRGDLARWLAGPHRKWVATEAGQNQVVRLVEKVELRSAAACRRKRKNSDSGSMLTVRSHLLDALEKVCQGSQDPAEVARLADSFTRLTLGTRAADAADRRLALLEEKMQQAGDIVGDPTLSPEQQRDRLKEIFER